MKKIVDNNPSRGIIKMMAIRESKYDSMNERKGAIILPIVQKQDKHNHFLHDMLQALELLDLLHSLMKKDPSF